MVYGIVEQSGGTIHVESAPQRGACFTLILPLSARPAPGPAEPSPSRAPLASATAAAAILVAEDEEMIREIVAEFLTQAGYRVEAVADGQAALEVFRAGSRVDLLLTDIVMPRLGGVRLVEEIWRERPQLPVVLMSGYPGAPAGPLAGLPLDQPGTNRRFLMKPFTRAELLGAVAALLMEPAPADPGS